MDGWTLFRASHSENKDGEDLEPGSEPEVTENLVLHLTPIYSTISASLVNVGHSNKIVRTEQNCDVIFQRP